MTLREELCLYIKSKNMTQREFASSVGISTGYANAILSGRVRPSETVKSKMWDLCGCGKVSERKVKHNKCYDCFYRRAMTGAGGTVYACHYMIDTGKKRGIAPQECYKHEGTPYVKKVKGMTARKGVDIVPKYGGRKMEIGTEIKKLREAKGLHQKRACGKIRCGN